MLISFETLHLKNSEHECSQELKSMQVRLFSQHLGLRKEVCIDLLWKSPDEKNTSK